MLGGTIIVLLFAAILCGVFPIFISVQSLIHLSLIQHQDLALENPVHTVTKMAPFVAETPDTRLSYGVGGTHSASQPLVLFPKQELKRHAANDAATNGTNGVRALPDIRPRSIAICGMAMRLPGGIRDSEAFWDVLVNGKDTRGPIPEDRYNANGFTDEIGPKGAIKTQSGYFLQDDLSALDTSFFTLTKTELERTDPQQRQLLQVTRELLENAGEVNYRGKLIGCYVGTFGEDWLQMSAKENQHAGGYILTGHSDLMLANRISFEYDLKGPR